MTNIVMQISAYILMAILLGYFFGWLTTRIVLKNRYQSKLDAINLKRNDVKLNELNKLKDDLFQYKRENKELKTKNRRISSGFDGQKYVLNQHNDVLDDFQKRLLSKDEVIETLTGKLSLAEAQQMKIEKKYEEEIDAFIFERIEITKQYKDLLEKYNLFKEDKEILPKKVSWFSKVFTSPSKTH
ncbi:MAG: Unknown protein [uncultured Sulfurovum sp.]|uniref:Uncharacterized protein n=1 Tax=uncultured Sulfurovum sp. TaxID=269237 RepID=A0A6S6TNE8_9BACT|nr:MAG: Unknown protein [uncultured Sulfurovum sp.]